MSYKSFQLYNYFSKHNGLLAIRTKIPIQDNFSLSLVYTPGVAKSCLEIQKNASMAHELTNKSNSMLVITDSSGLPNYNATTWHNNSAIPYVEGISFYYKSLTNIDAYPLVLDHNLINNGEDLFETIESIVPAYSAIELYGINEERLKPILEKLSTNNQYVLFTSLELNYLKARMQINPFLQNMNPFFITSCLLRAALDTKAYVKISYELIDRIIFFFLDTNLGFLTNENLFTQANRLISLCAEYFIEKKQATEPDITPEIVFKQYQGFLLEGLKHRYEEVSPSFRSSEHSIDEYSLILHRRMKGMIESELKIQVLDPKALNELFCEAQLQQVSEEMAKNPIFATKFTCKRNFSAIITDGTAVLGLGNIGSLAGLPVMEGKSCLFKQLGGVDLLPICLNSKSPEHFKKIVCCIAPIFNAINLEDVAAPHCFEIEKYLEEKLEIPVFHDDQHGTAIVVIAGLLNSLKLTKKIPEKLKIVVNGGGAAGLSITQLLIKIGCKNIIICDTKGAIYQSRTFNMNENKRALAKITNPNNEQGLLPEVMKGADVFIGVSAGNVVSPEMIKSMAEKSVVFALANPIPEIMPDVARKAGAYIVATGRSDFGNQVNNSLAFPGIFRGILDVRSQFVTPSMKMAAAQAICDLVKKDELSPEYIIPNALDHNVPIAVARAVAKEAINSGVAKELIDPDFVAENARQFLIGGMIVKTRNAEEIEEQIREGLIKE